MSSSDEGGGGGGSSSSSGSSSAQKKYKGVRCRKWGKWVSEIRVPGTQDRLWLGSYSTAEAAAVAHDVASYCLRGPSILDNLNFPSTLPAGVRTGMSPNSVQKAASDAGMAVDAQFAMNQQRPRSTDSHESKLNAIGDDHRFGIWEGSHELQLQQQQGEALNISVEDYL